MMQAVHKMKFKVPSQEGTSVLKKRRSVNASIADKSSYRGVICIEVVNGLI